ncbi:aminotransferase class IV family protein [Paracoccus laeviglucosivorans]|uniref:Probable branched-chain-amino-acid aminotransferase n=1 Tax=Paracoccus laeviglucosivorans TaxID=1197861 RepID=A0A521B0F0_9RHOB|nr:4-amino-4-deoxychorismate lyase [Paracoccus laeviglucosivorans]
MESPFHPALDDPQLRLIETALWDGAACPMAGGHLARLQSAAARLGWPLDMDAARAAFSGPAGQPRRLRLLLDRCGAMTVEHGPLAAPIAEWRLGLAQEHLQSDDPWLQVKSTRRPAYDAARAALPAGLDELVMQNERGEVCDGTITTIFFDRGEGLRTPPLRCGLLPGVLRADMLAWGRCTEEVLMVRDLPDVRLWVGNALRGLSPAVLTAAKGR